MTAFGSPYWVGGGANNAQNHFSISLNLVALHKTASVLGALLSSQSDIAPAYIWNGYNTIAMSPNTDITGFTPCNEAVFIFQIRSTNQDVTVIQAITGKALYGRPVYLTSVNVQQKHLRRLPYL